MREMIRDYALLQEGNCLFMPNYRPFRALSYQASILKAC